MSVAGSRREEVFLNARRVIMREGLDGTSLRRIAREGGFTTGVLTHYFADKRALISECFEWTMNTWLDHVEIQIRSARTPEDSVLRFVTVAIPHDPCRHGEWRLWLDLASTAAGDPQLATLLVEVDRRWEALVTEALLRWRTAELISQTVDEREQALIITRLCDGLGLRALITGDWDGARALLVTTLVAIGLPNDIAARALAARDEPAVV